MLRVGKKNSQTSMQPRKSNDGCSSQRSINGPSTGTSKILPKSAEMLQKTFCKEFWPAVQEVL